MDVSQKYLLASYRAKRRPQNWARRERDSASCGRLNLLLGESFRASFPQEHTQA